ncbi:kinase-related protein [Aspergillus pseudoustus]|uniref:Kinase-related protein n=1 Tax=Aspergillus pseudoustus TaxID=1810923 RepID=A0ABR4JF15_9EURO
MGQFGELPVDRLASKVHLNSGDASKRIIIGIAGVPGSGKSTLGAAVTARINALLPQSDPSRAPIAVGLSMDGYHFSRAHLASMADPATAIHRRGAAFTFDAEGFHALVGALALPIDAGQTIFAPSFDHATKDPVAGAIAITPDSRIVLLEGNYVALGRAPWKEAAQLMTELWYIDVPAAVAHQRLAKRHLASGIVADEKEAWERATGTDELNAQDIRANLLPTSERL